ncbi:MAG TPA: deoxyguanosinetriphosphate triphosphohydrolase, partial [Anaerolineales bacterium]|nr:deoxyguanosinetriphosphate triphosphohydrolase [Anaerolineales bacterium]
GGFDHNRQSLRIVSERERRFPEFPGLNLTWEVREGIVKHETEYDVSDAAGYEPEKRGTLEAQLANVADELAYSAHDLDDGLRSAIISPLQIEGLEIWSLVSASLGWRSFDVDELARHRFIRRLIGVEVNDMLQATADRIERSEVDSVEGLQRLTYNVAGFSETMAARNRQLKDFLYRNMYQHHRVVRMQVKADSILEDLFLAYTRNPEILPETVVADDEAGVYRTVCDYIAGMTDRFALQEHAKLFDPGIQP